MLYFPVWANGFGHLSVGKLPEDPNIHVTFEEHKKCTGTKI